jgi:hypothetical protein
MRHVYVRTDLCLSDAEVEALRGTVPKKSDFDELIDVDAIVIETPGKVIARLVTNCLPLKLVTETARNFRSVHGDLTARGGVIHRDAMMYREREDDSLGLTKIVPPSVIQLLREQNARLGLTGPHSDMLGYFDKTAREPFCRQTAWSLKRRDIFEISKSFVHEVDYVFKSELNDYWRDQHDFMRHVSQNFKYPHTTFSTVTVNLNLACRYHRDSGDFRGGMGNLVVLELGNERSGILVMPRVRKAFIVRPTDVLLMNVHDLHGNLPLTFGGTRLTAVLYARERIHECK